MSFLRLRKQVESTRPAPEQEIPASVEDVVLVPVSEFNEVAKKGRKRRTWLIFGLGGLFGLFLAAFFADRNDMIRLAALPNMAELNMEGLAKVLPAQFLRDAKDLTVSLRPAPVTSLWCRLLTV